MRNNKISSSELPVEDGEDLGEIGFDDGETDDEEGNW